MMLEGRFNVPRSHLHTSLHPEFLVRVKQLLFVKRTRPLADLSSFCVPGTRENDVSDEQALMAYTVLDVVQIKHLCVTSWPR